MRNVFFSVLNDIDFKHSYLDAYKAHAERIETFISVLCALSSAGAIYAWTRWTSLQIWWSLILVISQVAQIVKGYLPYSRRIDALKYLIPEMQQLVIDVENEWYKLEQVDDPDYIPLVYAYRRRLNDLETKYLGADLLPDIRHLRSKAEKVTKNHFALYIEIMGGADEDAPDAGRQDDPNAIQGTYNQAQRTGT